MRRDKQNAILGGVCAGLAKYFGMSILLMRILFLIGVIWLGAPILIYLLLWLLMPGEEPGKSLLDDLKLERDQENGILGGVCAGLGQAFGINVTVLRLIWVFTVLYFGFGIIPYVILWILMPKK